MRIKSYAWLLIILLGLSRPAIAEDWRDQMEYLIYSPRYFGPNAFPIPELTGGRLSARWEVELRGEYHTMTGDQTVQDIDRGTRRAACRRDRVAHRLPGRRGAELFLSSLA